MPTRRPKSPIQTTAFALLVATVSPSFATEERPGRSAVRHRLVTHAAVLVLVFVLVLVLVLFVLFFFFFFFFFFGGVVATGGHSDDDDRGTPRSRVMSRSWYRAVAGRGSKTGLVPIGIKRPELLLLLPIGTS